MIIIEKPYASETLIDTIVQNDWAVMENDVVKEASIEEGAFELIPQEIAKSYYMSQEYPMIYSNSESASDWVLANLPDSNLSSYIRLFKDKVEFRNLLKDMYPDFYYKSVDFNDLKRVKAKEIKYPIVIKPAVGYLSLGVHVVNDSKEWTDVINTLDKELKFASTLYPNTVINSAKFIVEELIEGEEFAIDTYFNRNGEPVILNIYQHPFHDNKDVKNRLFIMSSQIMIKYLAKFNIFLRQLASLQDIRNFPCHIEVRIKNDGTIIPIEVNPMSFSGWCTTDIAKYAWGINVYEYFYRQALPNWNELLENAGSKIYYFSLAEVPEGMNNSKIQGFDYKGYLANYPNVLELRRIDFKHNPLFAIVFGYADSKEEISDILSLKTKDYIM